MSFKKMKSRWARVKNRCAIYMRFGSKKTKNFYAQATLVLGFKKPEAKETEKADIAAYLNETQQRMEELPYIYRQLFSIDAAPDSRIYVGLNENFASMRQAYERWQEGHPLSCAVVGEKGSGKSIYIHSVNQELFGKQKVSHITLNQTCWAASALVDLICESFQIKNVQTIDELADFFNQQSKGKVIVFEGIHNLYMRAINGYKAIEQLIYLISETSESVFWVVSCSRYAWAFLDEAVELHTYFTHLVQTDSLNESQIEDLILNRHRSSGYELIFEAEDAHKKSKTYRKLKDDEQKVQEHLREKYFEKLNELSEGNASIAMIFWIRSIREFDDTHFYIAPIEAASLKMLDDLQPITLFVLAALVLHDTLNPAELSAILGHQEKESKLIFNRLKAKGILVEDEKGMHLNQLMYRQTIRELKERNILHLK